MSEIARTGKSPDVPFVRSWAIWKAPKPVKWLVLGVDAFALLIALQAAITLHASATQITMLVGVAVLALLFEEVSSRADAMRFRLSLGFHNDMTSVWTFAAAVLLPPAMTFGLVVLVRTHMWYRHHRASGGAPYRLVFTASTIWIACMAAHLVVSMSGVAFLGSSFGPQNLVVTGLAMFAYATANTGLVYVAMRVSSIGAEDRPSFWSMWKDKGLELATLCLAALAALALAFRPWMIVLVVPSMAILQRSVLTRELQEMATTDAKTGLLNAVTWQQLAERELVRARRESKPAAVLIIDMDNFKMINDTYGHLFGDTVLKAVADALVDELRGYDIVGRFGGEEFVAILSGVDALDALEISDRVLQRVRALQLHTRDEDSPAIGGMSASIGLSCFPQQGDLLEDLLHVADAALYVAKSEGRDRVEYSYIA